jgi:hypothetical protein
MTKKFVYSLPLSMIIVTSAFAGDLKVNVSNAANIPAQGLRVRVTCAQGIVREGETDIRGTFEAGQLPDGITCTTSLRTQDGTQGYDGGEFTINPGSQIDEIPAEFLLPLGQ